MIVAYVGPMRANKTTEVLGALNLAKIRWPSKQSCILFSPKKDVRSDGVLTHSGNYLDAQTVTELPSSEDISPHVRFIAIDEMQFFPEDSWKVMLAYADRGIRVVFSGLDLDFDRVPFKTTMAAMAVATKVVKLRAICQKCTKDAIYSKLMEGHEPGVGNHYWSLCADHYNEQ